MKTQDHIRKLESNIHDIQAHLGGLVGTRGRIDELQARAHPLALARTNERRRTENYSRFTDSQFGDDSTTRSLEPDDTSASDLIYGFKYMYAPDEPPPEEPAPDERESLLVDPDALDTDETLHFVMRDHKVDGIPEVRYLDYEDFKHIRCFQPVRTAVDTLTIRAGAWRRCAGEEDTLALAQIDGPAFSQDPTDVFTVTPSTLGSDGAWYCAVMLAPGSGTGPVEIDHNDELYYGFTQDFGTWVLSTPDDNGENNRWINYRVLFKITVDSGDFTIDSIYHEGWIEDEMIVTDTDASVKLALTYGRKTLDYCTTFDALHNTYEMHNVHTTAKDSYSIPYFESTTTDTPREGELQWVTIDAKENVVAGTPTYRSIDVENDLLSIYGFQSASTYEAAYKNASAEIEWKFPATYEESGCVGVGAGQTFTFGVPSDGPGSGVGTAEFYWTPQSGGIADGSIDISAPSSGTPIYATVTSIDESQLKHDALDGTSTSPGALDQNMGHDYRYWIQGDAYDGTCFGVSIGYGASPGGGGGDLRINLEYARYYDVAGTPLLSIDAGVRALYAADGSTNVLDWGSLGMTGDWTLTGSFEVTVDLTVGGAADVGDTLVVENDLTITAGDLIITAGSIDVQTGGIIAVGNIEATGGSAYFAAQGSSGVTGSFTDGNSNTVTVTGGIITSLS